MDDDQPLSSVFPMKPVRCYLCGRRYEITPEATAQHTHHAQAHRLAASESRAQVVAWLEECQGERDVAAAEAYKYASAIMQLGYEAGMAMTSYLERLEHLGRAGHDPDDPSLRDARGRCD